MWRVEGREGLAIVGLSETLGTLAPADNPVEFRMIWPPPCVDLASLCLIGAIGAAVLLTGCRCAAPTDGAAGIPVVSPSEGSPPSSSALPTVYALIWRASKPDEAFDPKEFQARIPRLMAWLSGLHARGALVACGGGGFATHSGGLTLVRASGPEEATQLAAQSPMNEIGTTDVFMWDVYYASMSVPRAFS